MKKPSFDSFRRGFASFSAVVLVGTTAIALTAIAGITLEQAGRTQDAVTDAQLRQLLLAGQAYLESQPYDRSRPEAPLNTPLPKDLTNGDAASLSITYQTTGVDAPQPSAVITATYRLRQASVTLTYNQTQEVWQPAEIQMP